MKVLSLLLMPWIALFLIVSGCSRDEPPAGSNRGVKVVKRIVKPPPKPQEKEPIAVAPREEEKAAEIPPDPVKMAVFEEKASQMPQSVKTAVPEEKTPQLPHPEPLTQPEPPKEDPGQYVSKTGDTLMGVAAKEEVYGDPLKWPILYRYALDDLGSLNREGVFHRRVLPEGLRFRIPQPEEIRENLKRRAERRWVVSVLSSTIEEKIIPPILTLLREGYPAYLAEARVKGTDWKRIRVGFFGSRAEAETEGKKIMALLKFDDLWVTKIGPEEFEEFAGY